MALLPTGYGKTLSFTGLVILYDYLFNGEPGSASRLKKNDPSFFRPVAFVISPLTQLILNHVRDFNLVVRTKCPDLRALCAYDPDGVPLQPDSTGLHSIYGGLGNIFFLSPGHVTNKGRFRKLLDPSYRCRWSSFFLQLMKGTAFSAGA